MRQNRHTLLAIAAILSAAPLLCAWERIDLSRELTAWREVPSDVGIWDFSSQACIDEQSGCYARKAGKEMFEQLADRCRAYWSDSATIYYRGYNRGRRERMLADTLVPYLHFPLCRGAELSTSYTCRGTIDLNVATRGSGQHTSEVLSHGRAIIDGDTLNNVFLVRETTVAREYIDIEDGADAADEQRDIIYRWIYGSGAMPIAIQIQTGEAPARLFAATAGEIRDLTEDEEDDYRQPDILEILQSAQAYRTEDGSVGISFKNPKDADAEVDVYLLDVQGNAYSHASGTMSRGADIKLPVPSHLRGQYIVAVCAAADTALNHKMLINL